MNHNYYNKKPQKSNYSKVEIVNSHPNLSPPVSLKAIRKLINLVMLSENCDDFNIFVNILGETDIKRVNYQYLKHNFATDIITFSYSDKNFIEGELLLGYDEILKNSKFYKTTLNEEFCRVLIHGCLHLLGYDDKTLKQKRQIKDKEDFYLSIF